MVVGCQPYMNKGTGYLSRGQSGRSVALTTHPSLVRRLKKKKRAELLLVIWAYVTCSGVNLVFYKKQHLSSPM
jgi:hypothetical protein